MFSKYVGVKNSNETEMLATLEALEYIRVPSQMKSRKII